MRPSLSSYGGRGQRGAIAVLQRRRLFGDAAQACRQRKRVKAILVDRDVRGQLRDDSFRIGDELFIPEEEYARASRASSGERR